MQRLNNASMLCLVSFQNKLTSYELAEDMLAPTKGKTATGDEAKGGSIGSKSLKRRVQNLMAYFFEPSGFKVTFAIPV